MNNDIYEVSRDEYAGFIAQLNKDKCTVEQLYEDNKTLFKIFSKSTGTHLTTRIISDNGLEHYYIFNMPLDEERIPAKPVQKITLETKEEVQAFFNILNKLQEKKHD